MFKAIGGLVLIGLFISPLVLIVFWPGVGDVSISALDAATAGVIAFSIVLNVIAAIDGILPSEVKAHERMVHTEIDKHTTSTAVMARIPKIFQIGRHVERPNIGIGGNAEATKVSTQLWLERYVEWREDWWGGPDMYRRILSRYVPSFLLVSTGLVRFIMDGKILPFVS